DCVPEIGAGIEERLESRGFGGGKLAVEIQVEQLLGLLRRAVGGRRVIRRVGHCAPPWAAIGPDRRFRIAARARCTWLIAVPSGMDSASAIWRYERSSTVRISRHARGVSSSWSRARC